MARQITASRSAAGISRDAQKARSQPPKRTGRKMSIGNITRRGERSWRLKFEGGERDPMSGQRCTRYVTVRGTKAEAQAKLRELLRGVDNGSYVEPSKLT